MNAPRRLRVGYLFADPSVDLSEDEGCRVKLERTVHSLREGGHEVSFVAVQPGGVVLIDTGYGLHQFFEAARAEPETERFASEHEMAASELTTSELAFCAGRRVLRDCDLIHTRLSPFDVGALLCARSLGIPLVVEVEAAPMAAPAEIVSERTARLCSESTLGGASAVVTASAALRELLVSAWDVEANDIHVLPSASEAPPAPSSDRLAKYRHDYDLGGSPVVIFVGSLQPWSGLELLLEAFAKVRETHRDAMLLVVGEGPLARALEERTARLDLFASVRFTGGVSHEVAGDLLGLAEIAVAPFSHPPFDSYATPFEIFEYMASGKAIVASRIGQMPEILSDEMALLVEPGDREELAESLGKLLADRALRRRLGERVRREASEKHTWRDYIRRLVGVYENVLAAPRAAPVFRTSPAEGPTAVTLGEPGPAVRPQEP